MCGLTGWVGNNPPNIEYLTIIGIFNKERGTDACGYALDDNLYHAINHDGDFSKFITKHTINSPKINNTMLIHTRKASSGFAKNIDEAHPHGIFVDDVSDDNFDYKLIGQHNGTLSNWKELSEKYNIDKTYYTTDSQILLKAIADNDPVTILQEYSGSATIMYYNPLEKNTLSVFRGGFAHQDDRPLFYWVDEENDGIYFSSIEAPLKIIAKDDRNNVLSFPVNVLIKFEGSKIVEKTEIVRTYDKFLKPKYTHYQKQQGYKKQQEGNGGNSCRNISQLSDVREDVQKTTDVKSTIYRLENNEYEYSKGNIVYHRGRYKRNGHPLHGIYELSVIACKIIKYTHFGDNFSKKSNKGSRIFYFFQGILLYSYENFQQLQNISKLTNGSTLYLKELSKYSVSPVSTIKPIIDTPYYLDGKTLCNQKIRPLFSPLTYHYGDRSSIVNITRDDNEPKYLDVNFFRFISEKKKNSKSKLGKDAEDEFINFNKINNLNPYIYNEYAGTTHQ